MKYTPRRQVIRRLNIEEFFCLASIEWCAHVTDTPDRSKIAVFSNGTEKASITFRPTGGHTIPISPVGDKDEWKNAQKNLKKNITSLTMKSSIPVFKPAITGVLCHPW